MTNLELAREYIGRGWWVHPLKPGDKPPATAHGCLDASNDPEQIELWWKRMPLANIGIACGPSDLSVLDEDEGLSSYEEFETWRIGAGLPTTYTVRTGRRPGFGVQMYFAGVMKYVPMFNLNGCVGQVKSSGGYVCAAGCLHQSGEHYEVIVSAPVAPLPDVVKALHHPPAVESTPPGPASPAAQQRFVRRFTAYCEDKVVITRVWTLPNGKVMISTSPCLLEDIHTDHNSDAGAVGVMPSGQRCIQCFHGHCQALGWARWAQAVEEKFKQPMLLDGGVLWAKK